MKVRLESYDWIVINTSAGKDSQAMTDKVVRRAEEAGVKDRVVMVHADLSEEEWEGTKELAAEHAAHYGVRFEVVKRKQGGILQHVLDRHAKLVADGKNAAPWPSNSQRHCTSDHKRDQIMTLFTRLADESRKGVAPWPSSTARYCTSHHKADQVKQLLTRLTKEKRAGGTKGRVRILNCMGMRSGESCTRAKLLPFKLNKTATNGRRVVHDWLPIFDWTVEEVWEHNEAAGTRHHEVYDKGMPRLSCCFCIFSPRPALMLAGKLNRPLLDKYVEVEDQVGFTFQAKLSLRSVRDALDAGEQPGEIKTWEMS